MEVETFNYIAKKLKNYRHLDKLIEQRELMITNAYKETDSNIGGGRSNIVSKPIEAIAINLADDTKLQTLKDWKKAIDQNLSKCRVETRIIIEKMYIEDKLTTRKVSRLVYLSESQVRRLRAEFFEELAYVMDVV